VTEYGLLYDLAQILGLALSRAPDPGYGLSLDRTGVFVPSTIAPSDAGAPDWQEREGADNTKQTLPPPPPPPPSAEKQSGVKRQGGLG